MGLTTTDKLHLLEALRTSVCVVTYTSPHSGKVLSKAITNDPVRNPLTYTIVNVDSDDYMVSWCTNTNDWIRIKFSSILEWRHIST